MPVSYAHHGEVVFVIDSTFLWGLQDEMCSADFKLLGTSFLPFAAPKQGHRDTKQLYNHVTAPFRSKLFVHWLHFDYAGKTASKQLSNLGSEG